MHPEVDNYLKRVKQWPKELALLRKILLDCGLTEDFKWRNPCYTLQEANVVMLGSFKAHATLSFFKGVLLKDAANLLQKPGENTRVVRLIPFTSVAQIRELESTIRDYVHEAIEMEKAGLKVEIEADATLDIPAELFQKFADSPDFETAFDALTPGRQRGYVLYFSGAKQAATRITRIEKYIPRIMDGKGINDCVCGLSRKMPGCDGSHKQLA